MPRIAACCWFLILGSAIFVFGAGSASTLPLAKNNQWVYTHQDTIVRGSISDEDVVMPRSTACTTKVGILIMTVLSVEKKNDSTLFTLSFSDSGKMSVFVNPGWSAPFEYRSVIAKRYLIVHDSLFLGDSTGTWNPELDARVMYKPEPDTAYSWDFGSFQRKTTPFSARVGTDSVPGFEKTELTNYNQALLGTRDWIDTVRWTDEFGMVASMLRRSDHESSFMGGGAWFDWSISTLLAFRAGSTGCAGRIRGYSGSPASSPARRCFFGGAPSGHFARAAAVSRAFSVTGRKLTNHSARQIMIVAP